MAIKQTAGRDALGEFAPKFAELNDDVLFGEVWSREKQFSLRDRSLVTVVALMAQGLTDESFRYHLMTAKKNGITKEEIAEIVTHAAFYCGWPKAWAVHGFDIGGIDFLFHGFQISFDELVERNIEEGAEQEQAVDIGVALAGFPVGNGLARDVDLFRQLLLRKRERGAMCLDLITEFHKCLLCVSFDLPQG